MKKVDKLFFMFFCLICSLGLIIFFKDEKNMSITENRILEKIPNLSISSYMDGTYQSKLESALSDQFMGSETIKIYMNRYTNFINWNKLDPKICKDKYVLIKDSYYVYDCAPYVISGYIKESEDSILAFDSKIKLFNKINEKIPTYYYFVNRSNNFNFETNTKSLDAYNYYKQNMSNYAGISELNFKDFEGYKKMFYKLDHHWNHYGSYVGYMAVASMMNFNDLYTPIETSEIKKINYIGSLGTGSNIYNFEDPFTIYKFNLPSHSTYLDGEIYERDTYQEYINGAYPKKEIFGHYANYYGGDYALVEYDYFDEAKENLLIVSNSYGNAVRELIASNYNKTYVVDLRHYDEFEVLNFVKEKNIDKILFLGDVNFFSSDEFYFEVGE